MSIYGAQYKGAKQMLGDVLDTNVLPALCIKVIHKLSYIANMEDYVSVGCAHIF